MKKYTIVLVMFIFVNVGVFAQSTAREPQFSNEQVRVWKTIIYPTSKHVLAMHRHDCDRVIVALSNGVLKVTNHKGHVHYLRFKKNKAYYLKKDTLGELHQDENITNHPITVMVIELK